MLMASKFSIPAFRLRFGAAGVGVAMTLLSARAVPITALPDISALTPYAIMGNNYNLSAVTVQGDAGISAGGLVTIMAPSSITGDLDLATGASKTGAGSVGGTTTTGVNLTAAQNEVFTASTALKNLTPTASYGAVSVGAGGVTYGSVNGIADVTVIDVASLTTGGGNINFVGDAGDYFVLNIAGGLSMTGSAAINAANGRLLVNLWDTSGTNLGVVAHIGNTINGTVLDPYDIATFHSISGAIYSGNQQITLMSGATVQYKPFTPPASVPDSASTAGLFALGIALIGAGRRKFSA